MRQMKRRAAQGQAHIEQLSVGFEGIEAVATSPALDPSAETMHRIVSMRMPDALLERVESAARARGVSPSSLMRALIAAGLDRSYAAVTEQPDVVAELAALRDQVEQIARTLRERPSP